MHLNPGRTICGMLITAGAVLAGSAGAATPESGTVNSANPRVDWKGEVTASWTSSRAVILSNAAGQSGHVPCQAPMCDTFKLEVGEKKDLTIGVTSPEPGDQVILRIKNPAGEYVTTVGDTDSKGFMTVKTKNAAPGPYVIDYWNYYIGGTQEYAGFAQLGVPAAPPPPAGGNTGGGTQNPDPHQQAPQGSPPPSGGQAQPQPSAAPIQTIALKVKVGKASAKKLKKAKKLSVKVTVSRAATVTGVLKKGKKRIGKGKLVLKKTSGTLKLKISKKVARKLKKGSYKLNVVATDGKTSTSKTVKVKVRK